MNQDGTITIERGEIPLREVVKMARLYRNKEKYIGLDNNGKPKSEYINRIVAMDDKAFFDECEQRIWLSAFATNNRRSDYHWQCDACFDESECREGDIYSKAHKKASGK